MQVGEEATFQTLDASSLPARATIAPYDVDVIRLFSRAFHFGRAWIARCKTMIRGALDPTSPGPRRIGTDSIKMRVDESYVRVDESYVRVDEIWMRIDETSMLKDEIKTVVRKGWSPVRKDEI